MPLVAVVLDDEEAELLEEIARKERLGGVAQILEFILKCVVCGQDEKCWKNYN